MKKHRLVRWGVLVLLTFVIGSVVSPIAGNNVTGIYSAHAKQRQLLDQEIAIMVGMKINPHWVKQQAAQGNLIYGVVKPSDTAPDGMQDYSYLATSDEGAKIYLFFKVVDHRVIIRYANHGTKLHTKIIPTRKLVKQTYRTAKQRHQVDKDVSSLKTEQ